MGKNNKNETAEYLGRVKLYDAHIRNKTEELDMLESLTLKITTSLKYDAVSTSGNQDKIGDAVSKIVDLKNKLEHDIQTYCDLKDEINSVIDRVTDADQFDLLSKKYRLFESLDQIAYEMGMSYRNACYLHGRALQTVEELRKEIRC